jgi:hypothetical protein
MDQIKDAFFKVKQDMSFMKEEIEFLKQFSYENKELLSNLNQQIQDLTLKISKIELQNTSLNPTEVPENTTKQTINPTDNYLFKPLKPLNMGISTGNEGVPTNQQTNQQTNQHTENPSLAEVGEILNSLDNLKKEIRTKFKKITDQEFLVFSTIYQMEEEEIVEYKNLSQKLKLTETSIRDYIGKLIKKGIPVEKTKINNKLVQLSIPKSFRKIAPLPIIFQLREI